MRSAASAIFALFVAVGIATAASAKTTCSCSKINAESTADGTCTKGEDTSSLCRMEWNGGGTSSGQMSHGQTLDGSAGGQSPSAQANRQRFERVSADGGRKLAEDLAGAVGKDFFAELQGHASAKVGNIPDPSPSRVAARTINAFGGNMEFRHELSWAVTFLVAYTYYPFAAKDYEVVALARALRQSMADWIGSFVNGEKLIPMTLKDPKGELDGQLRVSRHCLAVVVKNVEVMVKGPRSGPAGTCG